MTRTRPILLLVACALMSCGESESTQAACTDGVKNGDETGIDCGGVCDACQAAPTCTDGVMNGDETGIDCGGSCGFCEQAPTCEDNLMNGDETGVDCGGSCDACAPAVSCDDELLNGNETDVDCGGGACDDCLEGEACLEARDCGEGLSCTEETCQPTPTCSYGVGCAIECDTTQCRQGCAVRTRVSSQQALLDVLECVQDDCPIDGDGVCDSDGEDYDAELCRACFFEATDIGADCEELFFTCLEDNE